MDRWEELEMYERAQEAENVEGVEEGELCERASISIWEDSA